MDDTVTCSHCGEELKLIEDFSQTRCGHAICTSCIDHGVVSNCYTCGIGLVELMDFPELIALKDTCGDLIHDLLWYQSVSNASEDRSYDDANIHLLSTYSLSGVFSNMIIKGAEPDKSLRRVLEEELKPIERLMDSRYSKPGPKPSRR